MTQWHKGSTAACQSCILFALLLFAPHLALGVDHSPKWNGSTLTYNLVDLDNFAVQNYGYCKWGVLQDEDNHNTVTLNFTRLTAGPFANGTKDLFISRRTDTLQPLRFSADSQFPANSKWDPENGSYQEGKVTFTQYPGLTISPGPSLNVALFRYLHFSPMLVTTVPDGSKVPLKASTKKLIVLIHGWNPRSDPDGYTDEFASLDTRLRSQLAGAPDWKLLKYHWERDADTGAIFPWGTVPIAEGIKNGVEAAEIAHQHGQHLGQLLNETCPNLESIHLIAHSAGSWAARAAAKSLLIHNPNLIMQVTLLDPFIPGEVHVDSSLTREQMSGMDQFQGNNRIWQLENYYSFDLTDIPRRALLPYEFDWRSSDVNLEVDWLSIIPGWPHYGDKLIPPNPFPVVSGHSGPIQFFSDTVASTVPGGTVPPDLADAPYYAANGEQLGWWRSLFWNEPIIVQPPQSQTVNAGDSATFSIYPNTRRAKFANADAVGLRVQWQKDGVNLPGEIFTSLTVVNTTAASAGEYAAVISNLAGRTKSMPAVLTVTGSGSGAPTITQEPQDQTVAEGQTATFSVAAAGVGTLTYQWRRNGAEIPDAISASFTTSPVALVNDGFTYQVVVTDSQGSKASRVATLNVSDATGSCSDPNEPNHSSLTATPLAFGVATSGYVCTATDVDWFRVEVIMPGVLTFDLAVPAANDYDMELFGPDTAYIKGSYRDTGLAENITHNAIVTGTYYVRVYGYPVGNGSHNAADPYTLTAGIVSGPVTILTPPQNRAAPVGASASFSVTAAGAPPLFYQWQRDSVDIPSATSPTYATPILTLTDSGAQFRVRVSNAFGSALSDPATLTVNTANTITWTGAVSSDWNNPTNWNPVTVPTASDSVEINSGSVIVPASATFSVLNFNGGNLYGTLIVTGTLNWTGGRISFTTMSIASGGVLNLSGAADRLFYLLTLNNGGTVNWTGTGKIIADLNSRGAGVSITNQPGALFDLQTDANIQTTNDFGDSFFTFYNAGTFRKSAGTGTNSVSGGWTFINTGSVEVQSGALTFQLPFNNNGTCSVVVGGVNLQGGGTSSGTFSTSAGAALTLAGRTTTSTARFVGPGPVYVSGVINGQLSGSNFNFGSGYLDGAFTVSGTLNWTGGLIGLLVNGGSSSTVTIAPGGLLNLSGATEKLVGGLILTNDGTVNWTGTGKIIADLNYGSVTIKNQPGALFDLQTDANLQTTNEYFRSFTFSNAGTFRKSAGTGTNIISGNYNATFNNSGFVEVQSGALAFPSVISSGTCVTSAGAALSLESATLTSTASFLGPGPVYVSGVINGQLSGSNFNFGSGYLSGAFTVSGTLNWTGGLIGLMINGSATTVTIVPGSVLNLSGATDKVVGGLILTNGGTVNWTGPGKIIADRNYGTVIIRNQPGALFDLQTDANLQGTNDLGNNFSPFYNAGIFRKTTGTGTNIVSGNLTFINTGSVEIWSGGVGFNNGLLFNNGFNQTGGETRLAGGSLSGDILNFTGGRLSGNGTINASVVNGAVVSPGSSPGTLTINGNYTQTAAGVLQIEVGGLSLGTEFDRLNVTGTATLNGALNVSLINGFTPAFSDAFPVLTYASRSGSFATVSLPALLNALALTAQYSPSALTLLTANTTGNNVTNTLAAVLTGTGSLELRFTGEPGHIYRLQASTNLVDWVDLSTNTPVNGVFRFVDADAIDMEHRYYRAVSP